EGDAWVVEVPSLNFANADLSGNVFGSYAYRGEGPGELDLSALFNRADAKHLAHYLPLGTLMGEKAREWLIRAVVGGQASEVQFRLKGDLREFPFADARQGEFSVTANLHNGELAYAEGWPPIHDIEAALAFDRDRMEITGRSGRVLGARLHDVRASIAKIGGRAAHLRVNGQAQGPSAQFLKFVAESPLRKTAGPAIEGISASGEGRLQLKLDLPLADLAATKVAGAYELAGNEVGFHPALPPLQQAAGTVSFTEASFGLRDLRGRIFGGAVAINGGTRAKGAIEITARGEAQSGGLGSLLDHPLRQYLSGTTPYVATVSLRDGLQRVVVESSLRGITSTLPAPLEKAAGEAMPLRLEYLPVEAGKRDRISIALARVFAAELHRRTEANEMKLQRAAVWLSPASAQAIRLPERGLLVYGSLAAIDIDRWRALELGEGERLPAAVELKIARLDVRGKRVQNLALRASLDSEGWSAVLDADEIAGQLSYRAEGHGQLTARLLHFSLPRTVNEASGGPTGKPADLPAVDFIAERFNLRGKELGRVEFAAQPEGSDWRIEKLAMANPSATLQGSGRWRDGVLPSTELEFTVEANDAGGLLDRLGYRGMVAGGKAQLGGSLRWRGEPLALDYASLSGELKLSADEGEFLEIEPGLGKLISLMNLQALPRRITLDFRDVFSKGFRFDRIDAASTLDRGVMELREFRMRGPAAEVAMSGQADLARETQRLKVRVVPSLGGSASTVVGIVNPVVGVAAALAQHMLKNPLGQIFAHEFEVTGSWSDPKVAKLAVAPVPSETVNP
ncbi:MAG TPA: YhdP family protein, partial [Burkholderiales bacterium]